MKPSPKPETPIPDAVRDTAADWLARADAGLTAEEQREFQAWLQSDPHHQAAYAEFDAAWRTLDQPSHRGQTDQVLAVLHTRVRRRRWQRLAVAASMAILLTATWHWSDLRRTGDDELSRTTRAAVILPSMRSLPDGSVVELGNDAAIAVDYSSTERRVTLQRGEAHFRVAKNPARPFIVTAAGTEVRAVGTAFSVQLGVKSVEVVVTEGRVAVDAAPAAAPAQTTATAQPPSPQPTYVDAGAGVVVTSPEKPNTSPKVEPVPDNEIGERLAWRQPRLEFTNTPLIEAVALLNRHNPVQFAIEDADLAKARVSGLFGAQNIESFVRLLEISLRVEAERRSPTEIVLHKAAQP
ncbi:MAG: FecR domain-containing protein [Opitutae bacterium]|nr:FecR domain-containing protein [Opitutae bacterium]